MGFHETRTCSRLSSQIKSIKSVAECARSCGMKAPDCKLNEGRCTCQSGSLRKPVQHVQVMQNQNGKGGSTANLQIENIDGGLSSAQSAQSPSHTGFTIGLVIA